MSNNLTLFVELRSLEKSLNVTLGDGRSLEATGRGTVELEMKLPNGTTKSCKLHNVLYVPKLAYNLLSVSKASESGKRVRFSETGCHIFDAKKRLIASGTKVGSLYYLDCLTGCQEVNAADGLLQESKEDVWHRRYGHLGARSLQKLARDDLVDGFDYDVLQEIQFCESCAEGKNHRKPFPTSGGKRSKEPLGLVHSDVCGKMSTQSLSGGEYFLTFIDDYSRYTWVYVLKRKDQVFEQFLEWKTLVEKSTGKRLKALRTDNGGEYTSNEFVKYLKAEGVRHELTIPKTPEQNGVAERLNRTLVEMIRSMLVDSKLPQKFWAEALSTAVYLRNRSPTKAVTDMTPFEAWTGEKPRVDHLRVFGCAAYALIPKDERQKLDSKSRQCILLGYGMETKGYRLYDPKRLRIIFSRDVLFNESRVGIEKECNTDDEKRCIEFDDVDEEEEVEESAETEPAETEPVVRRSGRQSRPPNFYGEWASVASKTEPATVTEALNGPDKSKWTNAMEKEMNSLSKNDVWELVELPKDRKAVGSKWVFKVKFNADGSVERHKARLVAQGYSQKPGLDYDKTFSPVVRFESLRTVIALALQNDLQLHRMDVTNGELEDVYMRQPEGFAVPGKENLVCKLRRNIYGLKQSPRCWSSILDSPLKGMGFVQTSSDPCLYVSTEGEFFVIAVYVDDIGEKNLTGQGLKV